ncbi:MAG TPA: alkaline phosphatase family protein [Kofleriaceae bacterium]|nr:alkaline phosphatase family protein [Kofleriaceae bacterium]
MKTQLLAILALAGCSNTSGSTSAICNPLALTTPRPNPQWSGTVFTIVIENKNLDDIRGNAQAPFINSLIAGNTLAAGYHDPFVHPSEPNYLWMVAGENFGILDDKDPSAHPIDSTSHIADQIEHAGLTWKTYQESMGEPCGLKSHGSYAAKHDPFVYFNDINGWDGKTFQFSQRCVDHVVDYSQLDADLAANTVPKYAFITPNLDDDMHDGTIAQGDAWLAREVPKILASDAFNHGGVLFLLWDEGSGSALSKGDDPPFIAISPNAKQGYVSNVDYDTSSYLKTVQQMLGIEELPCDPASADVTAMDDLFTVPLTAAATPGAVSGG